MIIHTNTHTIRIKHTTSIQGSNGGHRKGEREPLHVLQRQSILYTQPRSTRCACSSSSSSPQPPARPTFTQSRRRVRLQDCCGSTHCSIEGTRSTAPRRRLLRQYVHFCTSKASKLSTCGATALPVRPRPLTALPLATHPHHAVRLR